jgi:hypothetical protein
VVIPHGEISQVKLILYRLTQVIDFKRLFVRYTNRLTKAESVISILLTKSEVTMVISKPPKVEFSQENTKLTKSDRNQCY